MARFGVVIVNYNCHRFLEPQIRRLRKYVLLDEGDTLDVIVADNSRSMFSMDKNREICNKYNAIHIRCQFDEGDYSSHHALALNQVVNEYRNNFNVLLTIDHDIFLFGYSNIMQRARLNDFVGLAQTKIGRTYLHPGCMVINLDTVKGEFNFLPCEHMDTGGSMADLVESSKVEYLPIKYNHYSVGLKGYSYEIIDNNWMHFIKGSNWNNDSRTTHAKRVNYLLRELETLSQ